MEKDVENLCELPSEAARLCDVLSAPPLLRAHLRLVHACARALEQSARARWPGLSIAWEAVAFGAATHDLGKVLFPQELRQPGRCHEEEGPGLLERHGVPKHLSRYARTHARWALEPERTSEDLWVALADTCWKGKRRHKLEWALSEDIAVGTSLDVWEAYAALDEILEEIVQEAPLRLRWLEQHCGVAG